MCFEPVFAAIDIGNERYAQCRYRLHSLANKRTNLIKFCRDCVDNNLVMYLHNHL